MKSSHAVLPLALSLLLLSMTLSPISAQQATPAGGDPVIQAPKDLAGYKEMQSQIKAVVVKVLPSVVGIRVGTSWGSGVIVSEDGIVMTAGHVVKTPGQPVMFYFADGKTAKGKTLGNFVSLDAGLMRITDSGKWPAVPLGHSAALKVGAWCVDFGHPLGYRPGRPPVVRIGRILEKSDTVIQTDCPLVGGDSGGPLVDLDGNVIGINSKIAASTDVNLHVPVDVFRKNWDRLLKTEAWGTTRPARPGRNAPEVRRAFREVVQQASQCVVRLKRDGKDAVLGTIVGPDGWILTKASEILTDSGELKGKITCRLRDGREFDVRVIGVLNPPFSPPLDLAMLKIDARQLPMIPWKVSQPGVGEWLASAGIDDDPVAIGVVSVPRRSIPPIGGQMGVQLSEKAGPARVVQVVSGGPAAVAGLKADDTITHINGRPAANTATLRNLLGRHKPGDEITLTIKRGEGTFDLPVRLGKLSTAATERRQRMNSMGVGVSARSDDFASVIQHDTVLRPVDCGGPVIDLSGRVIGVNIAHGGRTETYCLPTDMLIVAMYDLMSGSRSPAMLKAAIAEKAAKEKAVEEKAAKERKAVEEKAAAEKKAAEKAAVERKAGDKEAAADKSAKAKNAEQKGDAKKVDAKKADEPKALPKSNSLKKAA
ncbi:MAG: trypsin-like peptidase domain-containing protein [Thermoguttaceae bacterium]